jgi:hypothetical protein
MLLYRWKRHSFSPPLTTIASFGFFFTQGAFYGLLDHISSERTRLFQGLISEVDIAIGHLGALVGEKLLEGVHVLFPLDASIEAYTCRSP